MKQIYRIVVVDIIIMIIRIIGDSGNISFLGRSQNCKKATVTVFISVYVFVRPSAWNHSAATRRIYVKTDI